MAYNTYLGIMAYRSDYDKEKSDTQRNPMIQYIKQKEHDILLLTTEIKELKCKLQNSEAREAELDKRLGQSKSDNSKLWHQLERSKNPLDYMDTLAAGENTSLPPLKPLFSEDTKIKSYTRTSALDFEMIEQVCKSVISPFTEMANGYRDADIQRVKDRVTMFLTAKLMRAEKGNGINNLNCWIKQVENCTSSDSICIQMLRLKANPDVLCLINKTIDELQEMTWLEVKSLLRAKSTKVTIWEVTDELLTHVMTEEDDIFAFAAKLQAEYKEACESLGVSRLKISYEELLSYTVTVGMCDKYRFMYKKSLIFDCDSTLMEMEIAMRDPSIKQLFFKKINNQSMTQKSKQYRPVPIKQHIIAPIICPPAKTFNPHMQKHKDNYLYDYEDHECNNTTEILRPDTFQRYAQYDGHKHIRNSAHQIPYTQDKFWPKKKDKRRETVKKWHDWKCKDCGQINSGHFYKCIDCGNQASVWEHPLDSWQCQNCSFGRNNWFEDHYCSSCLEPNKNIPYDQLREKSPKLKAFGRAVSWKPVLPVISP